MKRSTRSGRAPTCGHCAVLRMRRDVSKAWIEAPVLEQRGRGLELLGRETVRPRVLDRFCMSAAGTRPLTASTTYRTASAWPTTRRSPPAVQARAAGRRRSELLHAPCSRHHPARPALAPRCPPIRGMRRGVRRRSSRSGSRSAPRRRCAARPARRARARASPEFAGAPSRHRADLLARQELPEPSRLFDAELRAPPRRRRVRREPRVVGGRAHAGRGRSAPLSL